MSEPRAAQWRSEPVLSGPVEILDAMNDHDAKRLVGRLIAAFPQTPMREQTASLYTKYLGDLDREATEAAVDDLIADATEFPTIAEIRRTVIDAELHLPTPLEAWQSVSVKGNEIHPLAKQICDLFGGTWTIRNADEPTIMRAQFLKAYGERRDETFRRANTAHRKSA